MTLKDYQIIDIIVEKNIEIAYSWGSHYIDTGINSEQYKDWYGEKFLTLHAEFTEDGFVGYYYDFDDAYELYNIDIIFKFLKSINFKFHKIGSL